MDKKRIVITGVGVVAPNGIGKEEFWANCSAGVSGIKPITLFDTSRYRCHWAGEISNFQPEKYLGPKGLRNLDRTTLLSLVAAKLAIEDAKLEITPENCHDIGVVLGSTMGSVHSISTFDIEGLREGPRYVNPALFPNTVINSPASQISIRFGIKGLNATIGTGFTASLNALEYAIDMLQLGRIQTVLVGGVEELCIETFSGFHELGLFRSSVNDNSKVVVLESPTDITTLGEGAGLLVIELLQSAEARGVVPYAEVLGVSSSFDPKSAASFCVRESTSQAIIQQVLESAGLDPREVTAICPWSSSSGEVEALQAVFGKQAALTSSPRHLIGECFSATGALHVIAGLREQERTMLVNNFSLIGNYASAILNTKPQQGKIGSRTHE